MECLLAKTRIFSNLLVFLDINGRFLLDLKNIYPLWKLLLEVKMKPLSYTEMKSTLLAYVKVKNIGK